MRSIRFRPSAPAAVARADTQRGRPPGPPPCRRRGAAPARRRAAARRRRAGRPSRGRTPAAGRGSGPSREQRRAGARGVRDVAGRRAAAAAERVGELVRTDGRQVTDSAATPSAGQLAVGVLGGLAQRRVQPGRRLNDDLDAVGSSARSRAVGDHEHPGHAGARRGPRRSCRPGWPRRAAVGVVSVLAGRAATSRRAAPSPG